MATREQEIAFSQRLMDDSKNTFIKKSKEEKNPGFYLMNGNDNLGSIRFTGKGFSYESDNDALADYLDGIQEEGLEVMNKSTEREGGVNDHSEVIKIKSRTRLHLELALLRIFNVRFQTI